MTTFLGWLCTPDAGCYLGLATYNARHYDYFSWLVVYTGCHLGLAMYNARHYDYFFLAGCVHLPSCVSRMGCQLS
mgnify:CR=1 FL=1